MYETLVDSKIQAIEAALKFTEKRQLPALRSEAAVEPLAGRSESQKVAVRREDLALTLLWRMEQRVAEIEEKRTLDAAWQETLNTTQGEHAEAIEIISKEVAALRRQAQKMERYLSAAQLPKKYRRSRTVPRFSLGTVFWIAALLGMLTFFLFAINR
jgi:hypothetical protein